MNSFRRAALPQRCLCVAALVTLGCSSTSSGQPGHQPCNPPDSWRVEMSLASPFADTRPLRNISAAHIDGELFIAGNPAFGRDRSLGESSPLVLTRGKTKLQAPNGKAFEFPRLIRVGDGLLMVWGEAESSETVEYGDNVRSLWHSTYDASSGWSAPRPLLRTDEQLYWGSDHASVVVAEGDVHVFVAESGVDSTIHHIRLASGHVRARRVGVAGVPRQVAASARGDTIRFVTVSTDLWGRGGRRAVVVASYDGGDTWAPPLAVAGSETDGIQDVRIGHDSKGVAVLWAEASRPASLPDSLFRVHSADGGKSWSEPVGVRLPAPFMMAEEPTYTVCGETEVVFGYVLGADSMYSGSVIWTDIGPRVTTPLFEEHRGAVLALTQSNLGPRQFAFVRLLPSRSAVPAFDISVATSMRSGSPIR